MAAFRSGFKIFGELTLRQSLGRIRSYSEDRKPGSWLPEDQWAVRPPCTTCPDPCVKKKPPKASKSWLSICKDTETIPCDIRHNNCPPPKTEDEPWYAFITKKKPEKPKPPLEACRMELQRQAEMPEEEDTCENMRDYRWPERPCQYMPCQSEEPCKERQPAPVIRLSCPPPKELDLMLWCGKPGLSVARIASQCQTDRMPYDEFRPKKTWKPPPYSLPCKSETPVHQPFCCNVGRAPLAEFKQVEIPKPVYTRYKSVELEDENFLLCMTDPKCPPEDCTPSLALDPPPIKKVKPPPEEPKAEASSEKSVLVAASQKPVKLKCAPKFKFRPKPTKLVEKRHFRNPCAQHKAFDLSNITPPEEEKPCEINWTQPECAEPPKVITSNIVDEPQTYQRNIPSKNPPLWMMVLGKTGSKDTPLVPHVGRYPKEPDWCGETDGLKFYDGQNEGISPKPPSDPCVVPREVPPPPCPTIPNPILECCPEEAEEENFILMPEKYNIRNMRSTEDEANKDLSGASFQQYMDAKTAEAMKYSSLHLPVKESILYDFVRNCPLPPLDPSKPEPPPRRPPEPECPQPKRFYYRRFSTFTPFRKPDYAKHFNRMYSDDVRDKCKPRKFVPKPKKCPPPIKIPTCDEMTLPCCPKARIPPRCDVKKQMPPCKKRLAPKPSYSECTKDPPPCPRHTECNAWEKKTPENSTADPSAKGKRFCSTWASQRGDIRSEQNTETSSAEPSLLSRQSFTAPGSSCSEHLTINERGNFSNANNSTSHIIRNVFSAKELMLNFVNPAEDSNSYYKSENLVKRRKSRLWGKLKPVYSDDKKMEHSFGTQQYEKKVISLLLEDHHTRNDERTNNLRFSRRKSGLGGYLNNTSPGNMMTWIGGWIKNLLRVQKKKFHSPPSSSIASDQSLVNIYVKAVDVDRIMKLTKPFRRERELTDDKVSYCMIDPLGMSQFQSKLPFPLRRLSDGKWNKALVLFHDKERALSSIWKLESLSPNLKPQKKEINHSRKNLGAPTCKRNLSRLHARKPEEYSVPIVENLGGRALLVKKNLRENPNSRKLQIPGKNDFRYYTATELSQHENFRKNIKHLMVVDNYKEETMRSHIDFGRQPNATRMSKRFVSTSNLSNGLSNNLDLDDGDVIQYVNPESFKRRNEMRQPKAHEPIKRRIKLMRKLLSDTSFLTSISSDWRRTRLETRPNTNSSKPFQTNMMRYSKVSGKNPDNSGKTSKRDPKDSVICNRKKDKPACGSKDNLNSDKYEDGITGNCRSNIQKKPGPNCPDC